MTYFVTEDIGYCEKDVMMGIYYMVACDELKERIDPGVINNLGVKEHAIAHPEHPFGAVVVFALLNRWRGKVIRLADDRSDDAGYYDYVCVTESVLAEFNTCYGTSFQFTGDVSQPGKTEDAKDNT